MTRFLAAIIAVCVNEPGQPACFELQTGKNLWADVPRTGGTSWSAMVAADGKLYVNNHAGGTLVFAAKPKFELLATNKLAERNLSSVAVADGELYIRTHKHLWCIGTKN